MTSTSIEALQKRIGNFPIELPAAAMLAGAIALVTLALPTWRFESAVVASGLPSLVGAAQPPLGETARIVVAIGLSVLSFVSVWLGLRALDRRPVPKDFPSFRAADLHPDAPRRRPILAGAEFGVPNDDLPSIEEQIGRAARAPSDPLPSFLAPRPPRTDTDEVLELTDALGESDASAVDAAISPEEGDDAVGDLVARLEDGIERRGSRPVWPIPTEANREELRRALGDLNRMAGRGR